MPVSSALSATRYHDDYKITPQEYWEVMRNIRLTVESWTGKQWDIPDEYILRNEAVPAPPQGYEFMTYLRHHNFPSPLLDWTHSFYVAAFFAFQSSRYDEPNVAIYSFIEYYEPEGKELDYSGGCLCAFVPLCLCSLKNQSL